MLEGKARRQIIDAYARMAVVAGHRPALADFRDPEAGDELSYREAVARKEPTTEEILRYFRQWEEEENSGRFFVGVPDFTGRAALVFTAEAARCICGVAYERALKLLQAAIVEVMRAKEEHERLMANTTRESLNE